MSANRFSFYLLPGLRPWTPLGTCVSQTACATYAIAFQMKLPGVVTVDTQSATKHVAN